MSSDFIPHLEELNKRVIFCLVTFLIAAGVCFYFSKDLLDFLTAPLRRYQDASLFFHKPYEAFLTHLKVAALAGIITSSPVLFAQGWLFVAPGLYPNERKAIFPLIFVSVLLFVVGMSFAYTVVIPMGLHFLLGFQTIGLRPLLGIGPYFDFLTGMLIAFGLVFDFPVILIGLVKLQVVGSPVLARARKIIYVGIFITAAILTPPDPLSQLLLAGPFILLFEISLIVARWVEKKA